MMQGLTAMLIKGSEEGCLHEESVSDVQFPQVMLGAEVGRLVEYPLHL